MQKESLLLHCNRLESLTVGGGKLSDLRFIRVLDLHQNQLASLPADIHLLQSLQVLDVSNNKLKHLPSSLCSLRQLQTLNAEGNQLKLLPEEIGGMSSLCYLYLRDNPLHCLPKQLCRVRTLRQLQVPVTMRYPPPDVVCQGTEQIMKFLCNDCGILYEPPTEIIGDTRRGEMDDDRMKFNHDIIDGSANILHYELMREAKRQRFVELERQMHEDREAQTKLALQANSSKTFGLDRMVEEGQRMMYELMRLHEHQDAAHRQLVLDLRGFETGVETLVKSLLSVNENARKRERMMQTLEEERAQEERWFIVRQEESQSLRRQEVLSAMRQILNEKQMAKTLQDRLFKMRENAVLSAQRSMLAEDSAVQALLKYKQANQNLLIDQLLEEEVLQKQAFAQLQMEKDMCMQRIAQEMELIENELRKLSLVEVDKKILKQEFETRLLAEKRAELIRLYQQLQDEKDKRTSQLIQRMTEMETAREQDQIDYWLIQYQRLLDRKPQALFDQDKQLEKAVYGILADADALEYLPQFQRHRITIETLLQMTEDDMKQIGVHALGVRRDILRAVEDYKKLLKKTINLEGDQNPCASAPPTTQQMDSLSLSNKTTLPQPPQYKRLSSSTATHRTTETSSSTDAVPAAVGNISSSSSGDIHAHVEVTCCICLDLESSVLFLTCGHICCCSNCAPTVQECPLCRSWISQRVILTSATATVQFVNN